MNVSDTNKSKRSMVLLGAVAGDVIGSVYEFLRIKTKDFDLFSPETRFTDDSVLTIASAYAILHGEDYDTVYRYFGRRYPNADYGGSFNKWLWDKYPEPYNSWGNGAAMRVSPVGFAYNTMGEVLEGAIGSAQVTHNHPEGLRGAQTTAVAIFLARNGESKSEIKKEIETRFGYDLSIPLDKIRPDYEFDVSCQGTVPPAMIAFLESNDYEDAVRNAISLGGDADTLACICGSIAYAFYGHIPEDIVSEVIKRLPDEFLDVICQFDSLVEKNEDK